MKILGKELTFNGNKVYHAGNKPTASEIGAAASSHTHNYAGSSSAGGNANAAVKLATARTINGTSFDGSANITTANWGTARNLNGVSVNGSTNYTIPVENYYCNVGDNNTNLYHRILTTDIATTNFVDKSLIIVMHSGYQGGGFGIAKITLRTNDISSAANSQGEIKWLVRNGFAENALVFNLVNQAKNACMDVFYKSPGTYAGMTWYVLSEGGRGGAHSKQWTKYSTNASGTNAYTEANMKTLRTYTSTLVSAKDAGHVSTANSASTLSTARTINGTSFNGSANITTANWGTARNIQIGNTSKSVNGSANVSWSLSEIGAAAASHGRHIPDVCETITDWNNATKNGWYMGNNATNSPTANAWYFGEVIAHNANYVVQTVYQFTASTDAKAMPKYIRAKMNGTWGAWTNVTVSKAVPSNAVFTDTNTWRGVQDNLTSTATDQSLSANQGKVLKGLIDGKAASNHTHSYVPLANGGNITIHADSDSSSTGEYALIKAGHNELKIASSAGGTTVTKGQDKLTFNGNIVYHAGRKPTISEIGAAAASHTHNYAGSSSAGGNANAAVKLATARTINGTNFDGSANITTANWGTARNIQIGNTAKSVNGSANVTWSLSEIGAAASNHTHNYLPLSGGTLTSSIKFSGGGYNNHAIRMEAGDANGAFIGIGAGGLTVIGSGESTNAVRTALTNGADETMIVASDQTIRFLTGVQNGYSSAKEVSINAAGVINAPQGMTGNASTATKLQTARTINGTNFDGSGNITTANWGTARNITIGNTTKSVNGSANVSWTAAEIGVASINDSTTATGTVWSSNKTQVQINTSYNTMTKRVEALEESINRDFVSKNGSTMTGDLTIKKSNGAAAKLNVHRTINSNDMQGTIDIYAHNGGSVALSTNNKTSGKQTSSYVFGGDAFWSPRNADGTVPSIGLSNYRFEKAWLNKLDAKDAIFTSGNLTVQGQTTLGPTILNNNTSLYGYNTSGTQINICGVDNSNNIYLGWNNQTYINVNNTMRVYRDLHILNGNALRVTGQTVLARTDSTRQIAVVSTAGDGNGKGDGQTHLGYYDSGYHHYFRGSGAMHVDMLGGLRIAGKRLSIGSAAHSNPATGDVWIQI